VFVDRVSITSAPYGPLAKNANSAGDQQQVSLPVIARPAAVGRAIQLGCFVVPHDALLTAESP